MNAFDQYFSMNELAIPEDIVINNTEETIKNEPLLRKYLLECYSEVLNSQDISLNKVSDMQGDDGFRQSITDFMSRFYGVSVNKQNIVVSSSLDVLCNNLLRLPSIVNPQGLEKCGSLISYVEKTKNSVQPIIAIPEDAPEYTELVMKNSRVSIKKIQTDELGVTQDALITSGATILCTITTETPSLTLDDPEERIDSILEWADESPYRYIAEYDLRKSISSDISYITKCKSDKVIYFNSFATLLCKGIPATWMILPDKILAQYKELFGCFPCQLSLLSQLAMKNFLDKGYLDTYLESL